MNKPQILFVEDDTAVGNLIATTLETQNYQFHRAKTGAGALMDALSYRPDVMLLDLGLPDMDGIEIIKKIRSWSNLPIIVVSARGEDADKVVALDAGADDYLTKPFSVEELLARIRAALRKRPAQAAEPPRSLLTAGPLTMDTDRHEVSVNGEGVELTRREFDLLRYLMEHHDAAVTRDTLLCDVWGYDYAGDTNIVDVYIRYLRQKIDEPFHIKTIHTIRAVGYMFSYYEEK